jgi:imidazolonepropionase-like amidohydrolase
MYHLNWEDVAINNLSIFYKAGGKIALGTDYDGFTCTFDKGFPITEVKAMKKSGMSNMDIIIAGTKNAATVCGMEKKIGTLAPGKIADILILKDNPLYDIDNLKNTYMVIHNGQIVY